MIGMLNRTSLLGGLKLSRYHYKVALNCRNYLTWSSTALMKRLPGERTMGSKYVKPAPQKTIKLQTSDGIPLSYDVIYNSFEYHTISQYLSTAMSASYIIFGTLQSIINFEDIFPDLFTTSLHLWISCLFLYVNIGTAVISYKSPVRIYHNKETGDYKAVFNAFKPFNIRTLEFRKGMVERIPPPDVLTLFRSCRYKINAQQLYMFDMYFRYPADLFNMFDNLEIED